MTPLPTQHYLPSFRGSELTIGHGQTHQHRIRDRRHFGFTLTPECWWEKNLNGWRLLLLAQNEGQFLHSSPPQVWRNQLLKCIHDTFYVLCRVPLPARPLNPRAKKKMVEVYLLYFLIIALWCKMCRKCLRFLSLKTLESVHMHCELGKSLSCHFTYRHAYCVTKSQLTSDSEFAFYSVATFMNRVIFLPLPASLL